MKDFSFKQRTEIIKQWQKTETDLVYDLLVLVWLAMLPAVA
jgi:hypothetical protein